MIGFSPEVEDRIARFKQKDGHWIWRGLIISVILFVIVVATAFSLPFRPVVSICWALTVLGLTSWLSVLASKVGDDNRNNELYDELRLRDEFLTSWEERLTHYAKLCHELAQEQQKLQQKHMNAALQDEADISRRLEDVTARFKSVQQHFFLLRSLLEKRGYRVKKGEGKQDSYKLYLSLNPSIPPATPASTGTFGAIRAESTSRKDQEHLGDPEPPI